MAEKNIIVLDYKDNFADNFSVYAYGKIAQKNSNKKPCYENNPNKRNGFEKVMKTFSLDYDYISTCRVNEISKKSNLFNNIYLNEKNIHKKLNKKLKQTHIITASHFDITDIRFLNNEILRDFEFKNMDFIVNHDILDDIKSSNSIGIYVNRQDLNKNLVDKDYIKNAIERLNKYVKKPIVYLFSLDEINNILNLNIPYKVINGLSWQEEFYFLTCCKHNIILENNSYSLSLWSALLNKKTYSIKIIKRKNKRKRNFDNWIEI